MIKNTGQFKKGCIPWNKGLSKEVDVRVLKQAKKMIGNKGGCYAPSRTKFQKGRLPWNKNKKLGPNLEHSKRMKGKRVSIKTEFTRERVLGKKNNNW